MAALLGLWSLGGLLPACGAGEATIGTGDDGGEETGTGTGAASGTGGGGTGTGATTGERPYTCEDPFAPCGGDPTGEWTVVALCDLDLDAGDQFCAEATWEIVEDRSTGAIRFESDGTYARHYEVDVDFRILVPLDCLFGLDCDQLRALSGGVLETCDPIDQSCGCTGTLAEIQDVTGEWAMDGEVLVTDGVDRTEVCIEETRGMSRDATGVRAIWAR